MSITNRGNVVLIAAVVLAILLGGGVYLYTINKAPSSGGGAGAGPESTNDYYCYAGVCTYVKTFACNTASSTLWSAVNPFPATSTARVALFTGRGNATTSQMSIGTTTRLTGLTGVSNGLLPTTTVATGTKFSLASGVLAGPNSGSWIGFGTSSRIAVGPGQYVGAFATSTYSDTYTPGFTECRAVVEFER